jgi:HK97 gp10 family phage protein
VNDDFASLAADLAKLPGKVQAQARGITAKKLNAAAADAQQRALALWSTYGRGMGGSAGTIRAKMSSSKDATGWVLADGAGAFFQELGTGHHPPQPVLGPAIEGQIGPWQSELGEIAGRL